MSHKAISLRVHAAVCSGSVIRNAIVRYSTDPTSSFPPEIIHFTGETHSTVDLNGVIALIPHEISLPSGLLQRPDLAAPGSFDRYLADLAAATASFPAASSTKVLVIEF